MPPDPRLINAIRDLGLIQATLKGVPKEGFSVDSMQEFQEATASEISEIVDTLRAVAIANPCDGPQADGRKFSVVKEDARLDLIKSAIAGTAGDVAHLADVQVDNIAINAIAIADAVIDELEKLRTEEG